MTEFRELIEEQSDREFRMLMENARQSVRDALERKRREFEEKKRAFREECRNQELYSLVHVARVTGGRTLEDMRKELEND